MIGEHSRVLIWSGLQHPMRHSISEFAYSHAAMPGVVNLQMACDYLVSAFYPQTKPAVAAVADLPSTGNTIRDYRVVFDDGDGKAAAYRWEQREGDAAAKWYKIMDMDWGVDSVLGRLIGQTDDRYYHKYGYDDFDSNGSPVGGDLAGQAIFGGATAGSHLTLYANSGDGVGAQTGFVQFGDQVRPLTDSAISLGTTGYRFLKLWTDEVQSGTLVLAAGSITDTSGAISFGDENLTTTGWAKAGTLTISGGQISDTSGAISFADENLSTTGSITGTTVAGGHISISANTIVSTDTDGNITLDPNGTGKVVVSSALDVNGQLAVINAVATVSGTGAYLQVDNIKIDGNTVSSEDTDGSITLDPNGSGKVVLSSAVDVTGNLVVTNGYASVTGTGAYLDVDNIRIDGNTISSTDTNGNVIIAPNGNGLVQVGSGIYPTTDSALDIGKTGNVWNKLWIDGSIGGTDDVSIATLVSLSTILTGASTGMSLFYNGTSGKWEASTPDTEIDHGAVAGLTDDDHSQYVLLAGRTTGQTIIGGTDSLGNLTLQSTANATRGSVIFNDNLRPASDKLIDIGTSAYQIKDLYMYGKLVGACFESHTTATLPSPSANTIGRVVWDTTEEDILVDRGGSWCRKTMDRWEYEDASTWDGSQTTVTYTVDGSVSPERGRVSDARRCDWFLKDNSNGYRKVICDISHADASHVTVTVDTPLPAGTYILVGLG